MIPSINPDKHDLDGTEYIEHLDKLRKEALVELMLYITILSIPSMALLVDISDSHLAVADYLLQKIDSILKLISREQYSQLTDHINYFIDEP